MRIAALVLAGAVSVSAFVAAAADRPAPPAESGLVEEVTACRRIADSTARLACYDASAARLDAARQGGLVVLDRTQVDAARRSLFGFSIPRLPFLEGRSGAGNKPERKPAPAESEINATIRSVRDAGPNSWALVLDDGATWQTSEAPAMDPRPGDAIHIKRAALGSYLANIHGQRAVRIRRVG